MSVIYLQIRVSVQIRYRSAGKNFMAEIEGGGLGKNSFDGEGNVVSRVRRGVLSLRVVRQMLT